MYHFFKAIYSEALPAQPRPNSRVRRTGYKT